MTTSASEIMRRQYVKGNPEREARIEAHRRNYEIADDIYRMRTEAGLTQQQLAELVGTSASAICRMEDANYEGHSLAMLHRIARSLNKEVKVLFVSRAEDQRDAEVSIHAQAGKDQSHHR
ncbi:MAG TPA: helix-turn-helix transcriptional regulator [Armatimonadota bacterium]|nr:helix-turn-helix transcriptional regulator [Armatimonadota bacterium]